MTLASIQLALQQAESNMSGKKPAKKPLRLSPPPAGSTLYKEAMAHLSQANQYPRLKAVLTPQPNLKAEVPPTVLDKQNRVLAEQARRRREGIPPIQRTGDIALDVQKLAMREQEVQPPTDPRLVALGKRLRAENPEWTEDQVKKVIYTEQRRLSQSPLQNLAEDFVRATVAAREPEPGAIPLTSEMRSAIGGAANLARNAIGRAYAKATGQPWEDIDPKSELSKAANSLLMTGVYATPVVGAVLGAPELVNMMAALAQAPDKKRFVQEVAQQVGQEVDVGGVDWRTPEGQIEGFRRAMNIPLTVAQLNDFYRLGKAIVAKRAAAGKAPEAVPVEAEPAAPVVEKPAVPVQEPKPRKGAPPVEPAQPVPEPPVEPVAKAKPRKGESPQKPVQPAPDPVEDFNAQIRRKLESQAPEEPDPFEGLAMSRMAPEAPAPKPAGKPAEVPAPESAAPPVQPKPANPAAPAQSGAGRAVYTPDVDLRALSDAELVGLRNRLGAVDTDNAARRLAFDLKKRLDSFRGEQGALHQLETGDYVQVRVPSHARMPRNIYSLYQAADDYLREAFKNALGRIDEEVQRRRQANASQARSVKPPVEAPAPKVVEKPAEAPKLEPAEAPAPARAIEPAQPVARSEPRTPVGDMKAVAKRSAAEQAKSDADLIDDKFLKSFKVLENTLTEAMYDASARERVMEFVGKLSKAEQAEFFESPKKFSDQGAKRLERALLIKVLGDEAADVLDTQWNDKVSARVARGMERAAPFLVKLRVAANEGSKIAQDMLDGFSDVLKEARNRNAASSGAEIPGQKASKKLRLTPYGKRAWKILERKNSSLAVQRAVQKLVGDYPMLANLAEAENANLAAKSPTEPTPKRLARKGMAEPVVAEDYGDDVPAIAKATGLDAAEVADALEPKKPARKGTKQSGRADPKALAKIATGGAAGAALAAGVVKGYVDPNQALGAAVGAGLLAWGYKKAKLFAQRHPGLAAIALPPEDAANLLARGSEAEAVAGNALKSVLRMHDRHLLDYVETGHSTTKTLEKLFGKDFENSSEYKSAVIRMTDILEDNLEQGRPWDSGLTPNQRDLALWLKENVGDPIIDRAEEIGVMPQAVNDGSQSKKMAPGKTRVRLNNWLEGTFIRAEDALDGKGRKIGENLVVALDEVSTSMKKRLKGLKMVSENEVLIEPGEKFYRQFDRIGEAFVPRIPKKEFYAKVASERDEGFRAALAKMLREENPDLSDLTDEQALAVLDELHQGLSDEADVSSFLANLDRERKLKLAKFTYTDEEGNTVTVSPYEESYVKSWLIYANRAYLRLAVAEVAGTPHPGVLGQYVKSVSDPNLRAYLNKAIGRILNLGELKPGRPGIEGELSKLANIEGAAQTLAKLTGGTTIVSQLSDLIQVGAETGFRNTAKALWQVMLDADLRDDMAVKAAVDRNFLVDLDWGEASLRPSSVRGKLRKGTEALRQRDWSQALPAYADAIMTALGIRAMDKMVKATAMRAALNDARKLLDKAQSGSASAADLRKLERYGLNPSDARLGAAALDQRETMQRFTGAVRRSLMYTGAPDAVPVWASSPAGSILFRFRNPELFSTRFLVRSVAMEAAQRNWKPLVRLAAGAMTGGQLATYLKDLIRAEDDPLKNTLLNKRNLDQIADLLAGRINLRDPNHLRIVGDLLYVAGKNLYDSGALGLPGSFSPYNRRSIDLGKDVPDPWDAIAPLSASTVKNALETTGRIVANENWKNQEWQAGFQETVADVTEAIEREIVPVRRILDYAEKAGANLRPPVSRIRKGERALRKLDEEQKRLEERGEYEQALEAAIAGDKYRASQEEEIAVYEAPRMREKIRKRRAPEILTPSDLAKIKGYNKDGTPE